MKYTVYVSFNEDQMFYFIYLHLCLQVTLRLSASFTRETYFRQTYYNYRFTDADFHGGFLTFNKENSRRISFRRHF